MYIYEALTLETNVYLYENKLKIHFLYLVFFLVKDINYIIKKIESTYSTNHIFRCKSFIESISPQY